MTPTSPAKTNITYFFCFFYHRSHMAGQRPLHRKREIFSRLSFKWLWGVGLQTHGGCWGGLQPEAYPRPQIHQHNEQWCWGTSHSLLSWHIIAILVPFWCLVIWDVNQNAMQMWSKASLRVCCWWLGLKQNRYSFEMSFKEFGGTLMISSTDHTVSPQPSFPSSNLKPTQIPPPVLYGREKLQHLFS